MLGLIPIGMPSISTLLFLSKVELSQSIDEVRHRGANKIVSNEGIFVGYSDFIPPWLNSNLVFYDLNLRKRILDLNIARNEIVKDNNGKFDAFSSYFENLLIDLIEEFLNKVQKKSIEKDIDFSQIWMIFYENYLNLQDIGINTKPPTELTNLIKKYAYVKCFSKEGTVYLRAIDILKSKKKIVPLFNLNEYADSHIRQIIAASTVFSEKNVYPSIEYPLFRLLSLLFGDYESFDFLNLISYSSSYELLGLIPNTWRLFKFKDYHTKRLIEFSHGEVTILNRDNRFLDLIIRNKNIKDGYKVMAISMFFETLKSDLKRDIAYVQGKQRDIIRGFADSHIIEEKEIEGYISKKEDFPPRLL